VLLWNYYKADNIRPYNRGERLSHNRRGGYQPPALRSTTFTLTLKKTEVFSMKCFKYAIKGIISAFSHRNFLIEFCIGALVVISMFFFDYNYIEKAILFLIIFLVLAAEKINSAIEKTIDIISPEHNKLAGEAKDLAAGAVLLLAICSIIIALLIILPKIIA
jgi:diacylglycerol kinase